MSGVGLKAAFRFRGESVHAFESFPGAAEASNEYAAAPGEPGTNHSFQGGMDGGVAIPPLKSTGPYAALVTALKRAKEDSEAFLKDKVEGPVPARMLDE